VKLRVISTLTYLGILDIDPLLVKPVVPELALTRVYTIKTTTVNIVHLVRALCDSCDSWKNRWDSVGIALASVNDPAMFISHMRAHAVRTRRARSPKGLGRVTPLLAALADRNTFARLSFFDQAKTVLFPLDLGYALYTGDNLLKPNLY